MTSWLVTAYFVAVTPDVLHAFDMNKGNGGNKGNSGILWSQWTIQTKSSIGNCRRWWQNLVRQKGSYRLWKSMGSKSTRRWKQNALQSVPFRMRNAAWPKFWASRMTSSFKNLFSRRRLQNKDTSVSSSPNFTANWILLRWFVFILFHCYLILNIYSTGAGVNTDTDRYTRRHLQMQKPLRMNALMGALLMLLGVSSITLGSS